MQIVVTKLSGEEIIYDYIESITYYENNIDFISSDGLNQRINYKLDKIAKIEIFNDERIEH